MSSNSKSDKIITESINDKPIKIKWVNGYNKLSNVLRRSTFKSYMFVDH